MPVFTRVKDDIVVLTADGDYTPGELARVGARALGNHEETAVPVLLDLSGAAGLEHKTPESLAAEGAALAAHRDRVSRLAVVVSSRFDGMFAPGEPFAEAIGVDIRTFSSHADARAWLTG